MARIRSIHPGLFTDESFMDLTVSAPLAIPLLLGLWTEADDAGTFEWKPLTIKARILPAATADVSELLRELMSVGVIQHFRLNGKDYGVIRNFVKFQRPKDPKDIYPHSEETRAYAGFTSEGERPRSRTGRPPVARTSEPLPKSPGTASEERCQMEDVGGIVTKIEIVANPLDSAAPRKTRRAKPRTQISEDAQPSEKDRKAANETGLTAEQFRTEWRKFRDHHQAKGSLMSDWSAAWRTWLGNVAEFQPRARAGPPRDTRNGVGNLLAEAYGLNGHGNQENHSQAIRSLPFAGDGEREPDCGDDGGLPGGASGLLAASGFSRM